MEQPATVEGLEATFGEWARALNAGELDAHYAFYREDAEVLDEDYPWRLSKAEFIDHIDFHAAGGGRGMWEFFEWVPRETKVKTWGATGHVSGFSTFRGKPRDAGFRQRFMGFTTAWHHAEGAWRIVSWHQSPLLGRIEGASPG
ncbi:MAG: YybH family protein [Gaiellales bacterium]